jgi:hypothetical protein
MLLRLFIALSLVLALCGCEPPISYIPKEGDIVFQSLPTNDLVEVIEGASGSPYSHVGLVIQKHGDWYVREAIGPVMDTPLKEWVARGRSGHAFDAYRLRKAQRQFIPAFIKATEPFLGRPYDVKYDMDDDAIYCSELLYKAMRNASGICLGKLEKLGDLNWRPYRSTIERYEGGRPPLERQMITPKSLSEAVELERVFDGYRRPEHKHEGSGLNY